MWLLLALLRVLAGREAPPSAAPSSQPEDVPIPQLSGRCFVCGQSRSACPHWSPAC
jgi:hypothetical protein